MAFCTKCGTQRDDDARFCTKCGAPAYEPDASAAGTSTAVATVAASAAVVVAPAAPAQVLTGFRAEVQTDGHFPSPRIFDDHIFTPVAISDNGYVGTWQIEQTGRAQNMLAAFGGKKAARTFVALHVNELVSFEVVEKQTSGAGAAALGGLAFGAAGAMVGSLAGSGKSTRIDLKIVTTRPDNPLIMVNLFDKNGTVGSVANPNAMKLVFSASQRAKKMDGEIMTLCSSLESLMARRAAQQAMPQTVVQQASAADEIIKFKQLLDAGVITQEEFDAKKRQLIG